MTDLPARSEGLHAQSLVRWLKLRSAELSAALVTLLLMLSLGSAWGRLGNPLGTGDLLGAYAGRTIPWGHTTGGYPFGMRAYPYFQTLDVIPESAADLISRLSGNAYLGVNLVWLVSFPICAALSCWLLRRVGAPAYLAVSLSVAYTFIPYHWIRGFVHPYMATMWSAVLGTCLALLIGSGRIDQILRRGRLDGGPRRALPAVIVVSLVVAWSGIYYAFFSLLLMATALVWLWSRGRDVPTMARSAVPVAIVLVAMSGVLIASGISGHDEPPTEPVATRDALQSTTYAGALAFMLVPSPASDVPGARGLGHSLDPYLRTDIESLGYGQFGSVVTSIAVGVYLLGWVAVSRRRSRSQTSTAVADGPPPGLVAVLLAVSIFFFVPWSGNFLFAAWLSPGIRSWDRLLPVIFLLLLAGSVQVWRLLGWGASRRLSIATSCVVLLIVMLDVVAPYTPAVRTALSSGRALRMAGEAYATDVNDVVPRRCGVLQLPYVPFPEKEIPIGTMDDYQHFLVALTNPDKYWSYGAVKHTRRSEWAARLSDDVTAEDVKALHEGGFCGIHLDTTGYLLGDQAPAVQRIRALLGPPSVQGNDGEWQFYRLPDDGPVHDPKDRGSLSPTTQRFFYPTG